MRKPKTKSGYIKKLDDLWSANVRSWGRCEKCQKGKPEVQLQAHHAIGRNHWRLRFEIKNGVCLCATHHRWAESNPFEFVDWFRNYRITDARFIEQEVQKGTITRSLDDYESLLDKLVEYSNHV